MRYEQGNRNIQNGTITFCSRGVGLIGNGTSNSVNINQSHPEHAHQLL